MSKKKLGGRLVNFSVTTPIRPTNPIETPRRGNIISWGVNNMYPQYIKTLTKISPTHSGIIEKFINLISGGGWVFEETPQNSQFFNNSEDSDIDLNDLLVKMAKEWQIWGNVCLKVFWDRRKVGVRRIEVIPIEWVRVVTPDTLSIEDVKEIDVCEDWSQRLRFPITRYPKFDPDTEDQIQYYWIGEKEGYYPIPNWISAETDILTEAKISRFHYRAITNGFAMGKIITFVDGAPADEDREEIINQFKEKLEGEDSAGTNVFWFADSKESVPVISTVQEENTDKKYADLVDKLEKSILKAHGVVNPILYGIRVQGGLSSGKEILDSLASEQAINISPIQEEFEQHINYLASFSGAEGFSISPFMITFEEKLTLQQQIEILTNELLTREQKSQLLQMGGIDEEVVNLLLPQENIINQNEQE